MLSKFPRYPLTFGPTPIEKLSRLTEHLGGDVEIYAKRDDCNSGLAMGGNKLRKLEYIVPDAIASGADTLVSIGGVQSNHTRMVAATAAKIGMKCVVIQEKWVPHYDAVYDRVGNILMTRLMGADSRLVDDGFDIGIRKSWQDAIQSVKDAGGKPYPIPAGASSAARLGIDHSASCHSCSAVDWACPGDGARLANRRRKEVIRTIRRMAEDHRRGRARSSRPAGQSARRIAA